MIIFKYYFYATWLRIYKVKRNAYVIKYKDEYTTGDFIQSIGHQFKSEKMAKAYVKNNFIVEKKK